MEPTRRNVLQGGAAALAMPMLGQAAAASDELVLWYDRPAAQWTEALPLGNGRIGAMVFGGTSDERIQINETTLWGGEPHDYVDPHAGKHLARLRELIFSGRIDEAEELSAKMMGRPPVLLPYQPFCDLRLQFEQPGDAGDYKRSLVLDDATATASYRSGGVRFRREVFVSRPDQVMVVRLTADQAGKQNLSIALDSPQPGAVGAATAADTLQLTGRIQPRQNPPYSWIASWTEPGLRYAAVLKVLTEGGTVVQENGRLRVRDADAVTIVFSNATGFRNYRDIGGDALGRARGFTDAASRKSYDQLRLAHLEDFRNLFRRVHLQLGPNVSSGGTTDARIRDFKTAGDPALAALYYQFGRYLLISSSRPGGQPANLQGIWNQDLVPA
ncbi:MAG: glycoside hydrolase N-terminal domain-containing protein, partial [Alphaproteobacteria bacterium]|nr:glycoside hydrolase N-terminal domain-containing protein [Alphaproteobacteria bacterium]